MRFNIRERKWLNIILLSKKLIGACASFAESAIVAGALPIPPAGLPRRLLMATQEYNSLDIKLKSEH
jgi:hypothetical protein